jgi:hypothetical protein
MRPSTVDVVTAAPASMSSSAHVALVKAFSRLASKLSPYELVARSSRPLSRLVLR